MEINIAPKENREGPDDPRHPDIPYMLEPCDQRRATAFWNQADTDRLLLEAYKKENDDKRKIYLFGPIDNSAPTASSSQVDIPPETLPPGGSGEESDSISHDSSVDRQCCASGRGTGDPTAIDAKNEREREDETGHEDETWLMDYQESEAIFGPCHKHVRRTHLECEYRPSSRTS